MAYKSAALIEASSIDVKSLWNTRDLELATRILCTTFSHSHHTLHEERATMTIPVLTTASAVEGVHPAKLTPVHTLLILEVYIQESQADLVSPGFRISLSPPYTHP